MKKILFILLLSPVFCHAQQVKNDPTKRASVRAFAVKKIVSDTLVGFSATATDNDSNQVVINYQVLDQAGRVLKNGRFLCAGACYTRYNKNYSKNIAHQILCDSVFKTQMIEK